MLLQTSQETTIVIRSVILILSVMYAVYPNPKLRHMSYVVESDNIKMPRYRLLYPCDRVGIM